MITHLPSKGKKMCEILEIKCCFVLNSIHVVIFRITLCHAWHMCHVLTISSLGNNNPHICNYWTLGVKRLERGRDQ